MTFIFFTLIGQIVTVMALAPSRFATFSAISIGYFATFWGIVQWDIHFTQILYWITGQLILDLVIAWFVGADQRNILARGVVAEAERARANTFVAAISHDLRQPLATLTMKLGSIKRNTLAGKSLSTDALLAEVKALQEQALAIETMVAGTLDLTRLSAGTWGVRPREIALNHVIDQAVHDLLPEADTKGVRLEMHSLPYVVRSDPVALSRILRNLIGNALRYTGDPETGREGSVIVDCELQNDMMCIRVTDNGIGIPKEKLEDIFKEYIQLDNPERDQVKGLGLGLSIVRGLANLLGHKLAVESTVGEGSRFSLLVPVLGRIPDELLGHVPIESNVANLAGLVVILVEDARGPREEMRGFLMDANCFVVDGSSAAEVIEILQEEPLARRPDFILADYNLVGGHTGVQAIREVREELGMPDLPAAIWTAQTDPVVHQEIASQGFETLWKPVDEQALLRLLSRYMPMEDAAHEGSDRPVVG